MGLAACLAMLIRASKSDGCNVDRADGVARNPFPTYALETLEGRRHLDAAMPLPNFTWTMEARYGVDANHNGIIDLPNSHQYANPRGFPVDLDASSTQSTDPVKSFQWTFTGGNLNKPLVRRSSQPIITKVLVPQGNYNVQLQITDSNKVTASTSQQITVRNYLVVALGDSYASGEGNPETPSTNPDKVKWADGVTRSMTRQNFEAHRSSEAAASQAALLLEQSDPHTSVTFINLAESGATIPQGMLGTLAGSTHSSYKLPAQIAELHKIIGNRPIDDLTLSIGGNDLGVVNLLSMLLQTNQTDQPDLASVQTDAQAALGALPALYGKLETALNQFTIQHNFITAYPDLTQVAPGQFEPFGGDILPGALFGVSAASAQFASEQLFAPLNNAVQSAADTENWDFVASFLPGFLSHGYAAAVPWFRTEAEARMLQGSETSALGLVPVSRGGFHPNVSGLTLIAQSLFDAFATN